MKKEKVDDQTYKECVQIYFDFVVRITGLKPPFDQIAGKSLKSIINWLRSNVKEGREVSEGFKVILDNYELWGSFYKEQIKLNQINSNIINICNLIKNGNRINSKGNSSERRRIKSEILQRKNNAGG